MMQENDKETVIIYKEDMRREDVQNCICTIKEKNEMLGVSIEQYIKTNKGSGIREDVLFFLSDNIDVIGTEQDVIYSIISLFEKKELDSHWYEWINAFYSQNQEFSVDDFMTLLQEALDRSIPLEKVREIFAEGRDDMVCIYESIESYVSNGYEVNTNTNEEHISYQLLENRGESEKYREKDVNYTGIFSELLTVVSGRSREVQELVLIHEHLNGYAANLQNFVSDITNYFGKIVNEWQKDREENARLKSLCKMQQKLLESQHNKIVQMREEIFRLQGVIQDFEKAEVHRAAMNQKINELHSLSDQERMI